MILANILLLAIIACAPGGWPQQQPAMPKVGSSAPPITLDKWLQAPSHAGGGWEALKGNVVVLEFWATWCGPCVGEIPHLNALAEKFKDRPVQFISITDEDEQHVRDFLRSTPIAGWIGLDAQSATFRAFDVVGIPVTFVVDRKGAIAAITDPEQVTEAVLEDVLAGKTPKVAAATLGPPPPLVSRGSTEPVQPPLVDILIRPGGPTERGMSRGKGNCQMGGYTLREAISHAYQISPVRVIAPAWSDEARYDFLIQTPPESDSLLMPLFRQALEAAFRFKARRETMLTDVYLLIVPKGGAPNLKVSSRDEGSGASWGASAGKLKTNGSSPEDLAFLLEDLLHQPVIDETGLKGRYDLELTWDAKNPQSMLKAVRDQWGLELAPARREVEMLIVEIDQPPAAK